MDDGLESRLLASQSENVDSFKGRLWTETRKVWRIAFPSILYRVTAYGTLVVAQSVIGHVGAIELAGFSLVQTISVRFANGILLGMSSATETLCGQAFGANQYHMMGIYLQRSWIIDIATATIMLPFFIFATPIYKLLGQNEEISEAAGTFSLWFISWLYTCVFATTIQMYLQAQQKNMIIGWLSTSSFVLDVLLSWIFVYKLGWKVPGAMSALIIPQWLLALGEFIYIFGGWCPNTWKGFSKAAFTDLMPIVKLSISSGVMLCVQVWYSSVLVLLAGYSKNATVAISAFSVCLNISQWLFTIFIGFLSATCVRVSNEIGKGNAKAAIFSTKLILCTSCALGLVSSILYLVFGKEIPYFFTSDEQVAEAGADLSIPVAFTMLLQSIQAVLSGVAIGCGAQGKVAIVNICSYYLIGVPIGVLLAYVGDLDIMGIWIGLLAGMLVQVLILSYLTWKIDWVNEVKKASERLNRFRLEPSE
ncbi:hypothetical protein Ancab_015922 [Ancistrocladus abbreviatus]